MTAVHQRIFAGALLLSLQAIAVTPATAANTVSAGALDVARGDVLTFRLAGTAYTKLSRINVVQVVRGKAVVSRDVVARIGPNGKMGRWVEVAASSRAATGAYRLDGFAGRSLTTVLPVVVNVVASRRQAKSIALKPSQALFSTSKQPMSSAQVQAATSSYNPPVMALTKRLAQNGLKTNVAIPGVSAVAGRAQIPSLATVQVISAKTRVVSKKAPTLGSPPADAAPETADVAPLFDQFDADANTRSWQRAYLMSLLSWVVYFPQAQADSLLHGWGLQVQDQDFFDVDTVYFLGNSGSTQGFIAYNDDAIFVAFQGSTTNDFAQDWVDNDLDLYPEPAPQWGVNVVMHHGFSEAARLTYSRVVSRVKTLLKERSSRKVWITGHSLGGAVAVITAFRMNHEGGVNVHGVYTFGAPPVGNYGWQALFDAELNNVHRWNIQNDPVVGMLPPVAFNHVGSNNNLYNNQSHSSAGHGWDDPTILYYPPSTAIIGDLMFTHMAYWCRLHTEVLLHAGDAESYPAPPSNVTEGCMDN